MEPRRCLHCGLISEGESTVHKSTCKPLGKPEDYMVPADIPKSVKTETVTARIITESPSPQKKSKKSKSSKD